MVNGIALAGSPFVVTVSTSLPSPATSSWELRSMGQGGRLCARASTGRDTCASSAKAVMTPGETSALVVETSAPVMETSALVVETSAPVVMTVMAGSAHSVVVALRDAANNPTPPVFRVGRAGLSITLSGPSSVRDVAPAPEVFVCVCKCVCVCVCAIVCVCLCV